MRRCVQKEVPDHLTLRTSHNVANFCMLLFQRPPASFRRPLALATSRSRRAKSMTPLPGRPCLLYAPTGLQKGPTNSGAVTTPLPIKPLSLASLSRHLDLNERRGCEEQTLHDLVMPVQPAPPVNATPNEQSKTSSLLVIKCG